MQGYCSCSKWEKYSDWELNWSPQKKKNESNTDIMCVKESLLPYTIKNNVYIQNREEDNIERENTHISDIWKPETCK